MYACMYANTYVCITYTYICMFVCVHVVVYMFVCVCTVFIRIKAGLKYTQGLKYTPGSTVE